MKYILLLIALVSFGALDAKAQNGRIVRGTIVDTTNLSLPGSNIKLTSDKGDSVITIADVNGKFTFPTVKGTKINLAITSIGFQAIIRHYTLPAGNDAVQLDPIALKSDTRQLAQVTIVGVNPVVFKEDTVQYSVSAYKVRENAPVEDVLKKIPGIDVARDGTVTAQGKQVTKVRVNGKDFFGGDVQSATKNLPADVIESVQVIDDYGDQANLTGVKTGEPNKILNFTIRKDKNYGYFGQATAGDGSDLLPKDPGVNNDNRYLGDVKFFKFNNDQQISVLGTLNNTNVNTFSFGTTGGAAGGGGFGRGGGGGRGNALRGGNSGSTVVQDGITNARSIGLNYRDQWGKNLAVYGNYSFRDNTTYTNSTTLQTNNFQTPSISNQQSNETSEARNHRFEFNAEWKPDTLNYLKVTPSFSYAGTDVNSQDVVSSSRGGVPNLAYTSTSISNSTSPNFGLTGFYNHKFGNTRRNLNIGFNANTSKNSTFDNPIYTYTTGSGTAPANQVINTDSRTTTYGINGSFLEPLGKISFLDINYAFNRSYTTSDKLTDTLNTNGAYDRYNLLSNQYNYTFTTNRFGLNYKVVASKYNYTLGVAGQPAVLSGTNVINQVSTRNTTFNVIPTATFNYNFSRSQSIRFNYNGSANQPAFNQLQPVTDFSNALYPVQGNPNLRPEFANNVTLRYNAFSFQTGNIFFIGLNYNQTNNKIVSNTVTYPTRFSAAVLANATEDLTRLQNTNLTKYLNADGYYTAGAFFTYSKPWAERKYTLTLGGNVNYTNNIGFSQSVDENNVESAIAKNIAKTLSLAPNVRFRTNITDIIDAELSAKYTVNKTDNSLNTPLYSANTNIRVLELGVNGKNYFWKDWTLYYDYLKTFNYGYASSVNIKNPNLVNVYVERRFLKDHRGTIRLAAYDLLNENTGFSTSTNGSIVTQSNVNRLGRYFLATFTFRLQKFSGKSPSGNPDRFRGGPGGDGGGRPGGGPGGPM
ncbi:outer membrane beta-barrel protein [Mucilaginibacter pallidiroseus]|uniref:Outer membrane beta-barrel protein n=1 Tax=Mucilaginibacter pallidiroseus TaxID=2599295 RepID=A0A563UH32_9SPHI|nr:outer membrane beta-barrel protein [Mucilaginibacter pallidiroseus]TWR30593.1 outer membrane beta-barrel protein [Mucilaginibacter pallidiroseus]